MYICHIKERGYGKKNTGIEIECWDLWDMCRVFQIALETICTLFGEMISKTIQGIKLNKNAHYLSCFGWCWKNTLLDR